MTIRSLAILAGAWLAWQLPAATLVGEGILCNSGEAGATLVRSGRLSLPNPFNMPGLGVVCDHSGFLWSRLGEDRLLKYSPDGRCLDAIALPKGGDRNAGDLLTRCGDSLLLKLGKTLYALPVTAKNGDKPTVLAQDVGRISFGNKDGWIALVAAAPGAPAACFFNPATGERRPLALPLGAVNWLELDDRGAVYALDQDWRVHKYVDGAEVLDGWPKGNPGERFQFLDGYFYGHAWHGTIRRFDRDLNPAPGVVYGGASGSFIGHVDENTELVNGRGLCLLRPGLFAVSSLDGALIHLLAWNDGPKTFAAVRRIGALTAVGGLGLDLDGDVFANCGSWRSGAGPDTPLVEGSGALEWGSQAANLEDGAIVYTGWMWGKPAFAYGKPGTLFRINRIEKDAPSMPKYPVAAVAVPGKRRGLLVADQTGQGFHACISRDGNFEAAGAPFALNFATPPQALTSFAPQDGKTILAAADGQLIELAGSDGTWRETARRGGYGEAPEAHFGNAIGIAADAGLLWVADTARARVLVLDLATRQPLASFGRLDQPGDDLASLAQPTRIACRGDRAVVYDSANQRLVRLRLDRSSP